MTRALMRNNNRPVVLVKPKHLNLNLLTQEDHNIPVRPAAMPAMTTVSVGQFRFRPAALVDVGSGALDDVDEELKTITEDELELELLLGWIDEEVVGLTLLPVVEVRGGRISPDESTLDNVGNEGMSADEGNDAVVMGGLGPGRVNVNRLPKSTTIQSAKLDYMVLCDILGSSRRAKLMLSVVQA